MTLPIEAGAQRVLDAALAYAACGRAVLPIREGSKVPLTLHGVKDATRDEVTIRAWWTRWPEAGVAIACGTVSGGLIALDCDTAEFSWALEKACGPLPETLTVATGRGSHRYFIAPEPIRTQTLAPHLEIRAEGAYVLAPPSVHPSGARYRVINDSEPVPLPDALVEVLRTSRTQNPKSASVAEKIPEGKRNSCLTSLAGSMRMSGLSGVAIEAALLTENVQRCEPPLAETEVRGIARSVARYLPAKNREKACAWAPKDASGQADDCSSYAIERGHIVYLKNTAAGLVPLPLSNFSARITEEIILDDGRESSTAFQIEGVLASGKPLPSIRIAAENFSPMAWVPEQWGARAVVSAGQGTRDRLREAIQRLSGEVRQRRIFQHTGWRKVDDAWVFLHGGGAIGSPNVEVGLPTELQRYSLPSVVMKAREAIETSLSLLDVAPLAITAPLWASIFRTPLATAFSLDVSVFLYGATGSLKSTLAALFLSHFGHFERTALPGSWSSTANHLEHRAFTLKDLAFVIDDYAPSPLDARELELKAARLLRAQGNLLGRGRLRSDLTERDAFPPRGLIISTGEQHPTSQSILARTLIIPVEPGAVDLKLLSAAQGTVERLRHAMAGYLQWLAPQMERLPKMLAESFAGARARANSIGAHLRVPEALAHLWLGFDSALQFAQEIEAISREHAEELRVQCWSAFLQLGQEQSRLIEGERPSRRFLETISTLLSQGRVFLLPKWQLPDGGGRSDFLGWGDGKNLYLLPDAAFQAVTQFCRCAGEPFPVTRGRLLRDLKREGVSDCDADRTVKNVKAEDHQRRLLCIRKSAAEKLIGESIEIPVASFAGFSRG